MRQTLKTILAICLLFGVGLFTTADEGMWMPHQMKDLNLKALGLAMDPDELYKKDGTGLMSAVVYLGGGTGEFVSPDGLILTNHHVAFGALQRASSKENDYIRNGFIAWTRGEEIQAKGYIADVLLGYEEVSDKILSGLTTDMTPRDRYEAIDQAKKRIIAEEESRGQDIRATVATMYSGNQYYLFRFKRIKDIRLVLAPPQDLGNFGGDIDNWMWPRHTCDFSFLRVYVSRENIGVDYNPDNIPYKPKAFLKISLDGYKEGDFSFVMGYPGRTSRNHTLSELESDMADMKERIDLYLEIINFLEEAGRDSREIQIKYASAVQGLNNSLKNYQGKIEGMAKISLVDKKKDAERQFLDWVEQDPARKKKYGTPLQDMADFMEKYAAHDKKVTLLNRLTSSYFGSALLSQAYTVYRTVQERQKPDMEREPSFQERQLPYIKMQIELAERRYDPDVDRAFLKHQLKRLLDLAEEERPAAFRELLEQKSEEAINSFVDDLYRRTSLANPKKRLEMIELTPQALAEVGDPMIALAEDIEKEMKGLREEGKALDQEHLDLKRVYLEALLEMTAGRIAPDANGTIRFTYGFIQGYKPRDAVYYRPQTSLAGVVEKDKGEFPFLVPDGLKELYDQRDFGRYADKSLGDVPVCFLNTTNVTGGNSGSPTLNAKGEQVGIIFDMTYESVTGDYYVVPELQRSISVDIRYVLFITERFSGAKHIIKELGL